MSTIDTQTLDGLGLTQAQSMQKPADRLGQSEFLKLMVTQLNNQDPLKPMENGEFYTQIAQFSTVAGIQDLQSSFQQVASAMYSGQALQASALVGRNVLVGTQEAVLSAGGAVAGVLELPVGTPQAGVTVYDEAGQVVRRVDLGAQAAGQAQFAWDGLDAAGEAMPPGRYFLEADILFEGQPVAMQPYVATRVESVTLGGGADGIVLNLSGGANASLASVRRIM